MFLEKHLHLGLSCGDVQPWEMSLGRGHTLPLALLTLVLSLPKT